MSNMLKIEDSIKEKDEYKIVVDKIIERLEEKAQNGFEKIYVEDAIIFINDLLKEIK